MATYYNFSDGAKSRAWRSSITQMTWATGAGHAAQTETIAANGEIKMICIRISSVTANPTVTTAITDAQGNAVFTITAAADGTNYVYMVDDFLPVDGSIIVTEGLTVSVDPSADAGGSAQTLTVDLDLLGT